MGPGAMMLYPRDGLSAGHIRQLNSFIVAMMGGIVWLNITTGAAMAGYIKDLGASDLLFGLVAALPAMGNAFQFLASYWMERTRRRYKPMLVAGLIQRLCWFPFALVALIFPGSMPGARLGLAVLLAALSALMNPMLNVCFFSIFNETIPLDIRGQYLGARSRVYTLVGLIMGVAVALLLDMLPPMTNYIVVFMIAAVFGLFDIANYLFVRFDDLPLATEAQPSLGSMMRSVLRDRRYMRLVLSMSCWMFAVNLAAPYFNVYARSAHVGMSFFEIVLTTQTIYNLFVILAVGRWGRAMDRYGNKAVLVISGLLSSFMPLFWVRMGPGMMWAAALANALGGATFCAAELSAQSMFMTEAPEKNRSMYFAVYFAFTQLLGQTLGSTAGGFLLDNVFSRLEPLNLTLGGLAFTRYNALFALSMLLRLAAVLLVLTRIKTRADDHMSEMARSLLRRTQKG